MKAKIFFITTAIILILTSCEKEVRDPGFFDGTTLRFSVATGAFGINRDIVFDIIVTGGDHITEIRVTNLGGTNPIVPVLLGGATTTPIPAQPPITLPVTLDPATGLRRATFNRTLAALGLNPTGTSRVTLFAEVMVDGNQVFAVLPVVLAGTATAGVSNFRVSYSGNGSTGGFVPLDLAFYTAAGIGSTVTLSANTGVLVRTGHKFVGWNTLADGTGTNFAPRRGVVMGAADRTFFARWVTDATPTFRITYDSNGATNGSVPFDANIYLSGESVPALTNVFGLERAGRTFGGWNTAADGTGTAVAAGSSTFVMPAANTTLFAIWL